MASSSIFKRLRFSQLEDRTVPAGPRATLDLNPTGGSLPPLTIHVDSFSFGYINESANSLPVATEFESLKVDASYTENSPILLQALTCGQHFTYGLLTQFNASDQPVAAWALDTLFVAQDDVRGGVVSLPGESIVFEVKAVTVATSTAKASWDQTKSTPTGPSLPSKLALQPLPTEAKPAITLALLPLTGQSTPPAVTLPVIDFQLGYDVTTTIGKTHFDQMHVSFPMQASSPTIMSTINNLQQYGSAVLTQRDSAGKSVAAWVMSSVFLNRLVASGGDGMPTEELSFSFRAMSEITKTRFASWDVAENNATGPSWPNGLTLSSYPAGPTNPSITLELKTGASATVPLTLPITDYAWSFSNPSDIGGGLPTGAMFDSLTVETPVSTDSPVLFAVLANQLVYSGAVLTQRNDLGQPVVGWSAGLVVIADIETHGGAGLPTTTVEFKFARLTEATSTRTASWDITTKKATGPTAPTGLSPLPTAPGQPALTIEFRNNVAQSSPATFVLPLDTFSFGSEVIREVAGFGDSKFDRLQVTLPFAANSPLLFGALTKGAQYDTAQIIQRDKNGQPIVAWELDTVYVDSIATTGGTGLPKESVELTVVAITEATNTTKSSWDQTKDQAIGPTVTGVTLAPYPTSGGQPAVTLALIPSNGSELPSITLALDDYAFGFAQVPVGIGGAEAQFDDLAVNASYTANSPTLLKTLMSYAIYDRAVLIQRDANGKSTIGWVMDDVRVVDRVVSGADTAPTQTIAIEFFAVTEATKAQVASWDRKTSTATGPVEPPISASLPVANQPLVTLELVPANTLHAVTLPVKSFAFGFDLPVDLGSIGAPGSGQAKFDRLVVTTDFMAESPYLLQAATEGGPYAQAILTQRNGAYQTAAMWVLSTPVVARLDTDAAGNVPTQTVQIVFNAITVATDEQQWRWDRTKVNNEGPNLPPGTVFSPLVTPPPTVVGTKVNDGSVQRSRVEQLTVTFSSNVLLPANPASAFTLNGPNGPVAVNVSVAAGTPTVVTIDTGNLPDGLYSLSVNPALVTDHVGAQLDGDANGTAGGNYTFNFHRLFGDADGDRDVDTSDFAAFRVAYGGTNAVFDYDSDGDVDTSDFGQFRARFGATV